MREYEETRGLSGLGRKLAARDAAGCTRDVRAQRARIVQVLSDAVGTVEKLLAEVERLEDEVGRRDATIAVLRGNEPGTLAAAYNVGFAEGRSSVVAHESTEVASLRRRDTRERYLKVMEALSCVGVVPKPAGPPSQEVRLGGGVKEKKT